MINYFRESLIESIAMWYMKLDHGQIHTWTNLIKAFLARYDHVVDTALDRMSLMTMKKKEMRALRIMLNDGVTLLLRSSFI